MTAIGVTGGQRLRVDEVLLAGETPDGPALVSIEALVVDESGLTIVGPRRGVERLVPWSEISGFQGPRAASLPTGASALAMVLEVRGRSLRFLLPDASVPGSVVAELDREIAAHVVASDHGEPSAADHGAPSAVDNGEGPVRLTSPTPHMPPTVELHPVVDPDNSAGGAPSAASLPPAAVPVPPRVVPFDTRTGAVGGPATPGAAATPDAAATPGAARPVPPRAVPLPTPKGPASVAPHARDDHDTDEWDPDDIEDHAFFTVDDEMLVAPPPPSKRDRRKRGVRQSKTVVAKPLLAAEEFEFSSDPSLPRGGPAPGAVIEVSRHHRTAKRAAILFVVLVFVATGAGVWYYTKHHALPGLSQSAPPPDYARDLAIADYALIANPAQDPRPISAAQTLNLPAQQAADLPGWSAKPMNAANPFALGAASSAQASRASAAASGSLARCLDVSQATLSAATGVAGGTVTDQTAMQGSRLYTAPSGDQSTTNSVTQVMDSSSVVQADAKVFQNEMLFSTCYEPYVQSMLPFLASSLGPNQKLDAATVQPMAVPAPVAHSGVRAFGFQITLLGHSGNNGFSVVLDDVAVLGGRAQTTMSMSSAVVFPVDAQASLVSAAESRVAAAVKR